MKFLITGSDTAPGRHILAEMSQEGFQAMGLPQADVRSKDIHNELRRIAPDFIINAHHWYGVQRCELEQERCLQLNYELVRSMAAYAAQFRIPMLHLSSCQVFDGKRKNPYKTTNQGNPINFFGSCCWRSELVVKEQLEQFIVLRLGWLMGTQDDPVLDSVHSALAASQPAYFSDAYRGNPTAPADVARVVVAMLKQVLCDSPLWGTYHYAGAETVSKFAYAQAVAQALQPDTDVSAWIRCATHNDASTPEPRNAALGCIKIRNSFGIKQRSWRRYLSHLAAENADGNDEDDAGSLPARVASASS